MLFETEQDRGDVCLSPSCPVIALVAIYSHNVKVYFSLLQV